MRRHNDVRPIEHPYEEDDDDPADYNDEYDCGINPMAAMMGFTGFGGSKK